MKKLRIAILGQGRSGRDIHGAFFLNEANTFCEVVAVVEENDYRREKAAREFGCDTYINYTELFGRKDIDLVVNASYSQMHYPISKDLLEHGFNVLSEKPFGRTYYECMDLIHTAKKHGVLISAFQQTIITPAFLNVKKIIESGKLGEIQQINVKYSNFKRRWDWQTLQSKCAGGLYNTGPHPIGQGLALIDWDASARVAFSSLKRVLTSGDGDDYAKVIITAEGKPVIDVEVISADAYGNDYVFKIYGSKGTLVSSNSSYEMKYIEDFSAYPERPVVPGFFAKPNGDPSYCSEKLDLTVESGKIEGSSFDSAVHDFYRMLYGAILEGKPLTVTPEMAAQTVRIIEACHAENPLSVEYD